MRGVAVLSQIGGQTATPAQAVSTIASMRSNFLNALRTEGVTMLSLRFPRRALLTTNFELDARALDAGLAIANEAGVEFMPRWMDGHHLPTSLMGATLTDVAGTWPRPFDNPDYIAMAGEFAAEMSAWAMAHNVVELHTSSSGREWAEPAGGATVQNALGFSWTKFQEFHRALIGTYLDAIDPRIVVEHPLSGWGVLYTNYSSAPAIAEYCQARGRNVILQGNGVDNTRMWGGAGGTTGSEAQFNQNVTPHIGGHVRLAGQDIGEAVAGTLDGNAVLNNVIDVRNLIALELYETRWRPLESWVNTVVPQMTAAMVAN
jgi:hypothetical protein